MGRRKVSNMLALALLALVAERPMHPYEMASVLRERGKDDSIKINWGSLYTVAQNLEKHGFVEVTETTWQGGRPERTIYGISASGRAELEDWMRDLIGRPELEYPRFEAALSLLGVLPPAEALALLRDRDAALDRGVITQRAALAEVSKDVPRMFLIESEYRVAMCQAEAEWTRGLLAELEDGSLPGMTWWQHFHETGQIHPDVA